MRISPARVAAFDILKRIETERAYSSALLPAYESGLSPLDRGLCHELVLGVLRRQIWLDRVIDLLAGGKKLDLSVRIALRLGLYQIKFLEKIPPHAAVSESVNLVQRAKKTSAKGFVNAILRRVITAPVDPQPSDEIDRVVLETSHPRWLIERWIERFGPDDASTLAAANNSPGPIAFRVISASVEVTSTVPGARASADVPGCDIIQQNSRELLELHAESRVYFQDEASQMVARAVAVPGNGSFLDVCAAPGGKTGLIASINRSAFVAAGDIHRSRVEFLKANLDRQGCGNVAIAQYDATAALPFAEGIFDAVLVDAPCSGTGTIRRNPEIRYSLTPADLDELPRKQLAILNNAARVLKPGGLLLYSTCSLEPEENEDVVARFQAGCDDLYSTRPDVPERFLTSESQARTWPHRDGMDGFFVTAFRKHASKC